MQIQSWWRGRVVYRSVQKQMKALLVLQCFARCILARQEYMQRRFVFMLIQTAELERKKKIKTLKIREQQEEKMEERQRDAAARVIQRFFLHVKNEVDQLVLATKQRRKWRKMMRTDKRTDDVEEALLEHVWLDLVTHSNSDEEEPFVRHYSNIVDSKVGEGSRRALSSLRKQYQFANPSIDDDAACEFISNAHTTTPIRIIRKVDAIDMEDDFQLEEAFIDAGIFHAKERRYLAGISKSKKSKNKSSVIGDGKEKFNKRAGREHYNINDEVNVLTM